MSLTSSSSLGLDTAKNGAGAPQGEKTPWNNQWARGGDEDDLPDFEEVDYENPGYSSGTEGMAPNTGRCVDALTIKGSACLYWPQGNGPPNNARHPSAMPI